MSIPAGSYIPRTSSARGSDQNTEKIIKVNKDEISAYYDMGMNYQVMGKQGEAAEVIQKVSGKLVEKNRLSKYPESLRHIFHLGIASATTE